MQHAACNMQHAAHHAPVPALTCAVVRYAFSLCDDVTADAMHAMLAREELRLSRAIKDCAASAAAGASATDGSMGADAETLTAVLARLQAQRYAIPVSTCSGAAAAALCNLPLRRRRNHMLSCAAVPRPYAVSL